MQLPVQITYRGMDKFRRHRRRGARPGRQARAVPSAHRELPRRDRAAGAAQAARQAVRRAHRPQGAGGEIAVNRDHHEDVYVALRDAFDAARRKLEDFAREQRGDVKHHGPRRVGQGGAHPGRGRLRLHRHRRRSRAVLLARERGDPAVRAPGPGDRGAFHRGAGGRRACRRSASARARRLVSRVADRQSRRRRLACRAPRRQSSASEACGTRPSRGLAPRLPSPLGASRWGPLARRAVQPRAARGLGQAHESSDGGSRTARQRAARRHHRHAPHAVLAHGAQHLGETVLLAHHEQPALITSPTVSVRASSSFAIAATTMSRSVRMPTGTRSLGAIHHHHQAADMALAHQLRGLGQARVRRAITTSCRSSASGQSSPI